MRQGLRSAAAVSMAAAIICFARSSGTLHGQGRVLTALSETAGAVLDWDNTVNRMVRTDELRVRQRRTDTLLPGRSIERLAQYYKGVRVWGGDISRQLDGSSTASVFGTIYADVAVDVSPTLTAQDAKLVIERIGGAELGADRIPELVVLPADDGAFRLVWVGEIAAAGDIVRLFVDARTGEVARRYSIRRNQAANAAIGHGRGVLGDDKKVSALAFAGAFIAADPLRPPTLNTYDMKSNLSRVEQFINGVVSLSIADIALDSDNDWTDGAAVDAHVYAGYTYDYYFKRFGRRGLDNADKRILSLVHPVNRNDIFTASPDEIGCCYLNAGYYGNGVMLYGEGMPPGVYVVSSGQHWDYTSGALDIVAHELTHGVTDYTSNLEYVNESGALNEAFSDIMATSIEFYFQPAGSGPLKADYLLGEDVVTAYRAGSRSGIRSMENPALFGQPDHYSKRLIVPADDAHDNGGVHANSGIPNQAFYLAIEGGTNRTSGIRVQGVGAANREQMERVFYRAFAQLMTSNANFSMARSLTLRAAQDLYGAGSAPYNAVLDAWTAVGVN
jgi:bacillolysin